MRHARELSAAARSSRIAGVNIADACAMQISDLAERHRGELAVDSACEHIVIRARR
jgi:hypothetical protein